MSSINNNTLSQDYYYQLAQTANSATPIGCRNRGRRTALGRLRQLVESVEFDEPGHRSEQIRRARSPAATSSSWRSGGGGGLSQIINTVENALQNRRRAARPIRIR